jgi:hypothetical protein
MSYDIETQKGVSWIGKIQFKNTPGYKGFDCNYILQCCCEEISYVMSVDHY